MSAVCVFSVPALQSELPIFLSIFYFSHKSKNIILSVPVDCRRVATPFYNTFSLIKHQMFWTEMKEDVHVNFVHWRNFRSRSFIDFLDTAWAVFNLVFLPYKTFPENWKFPPVLIKATRKMKSEKDFMFVSIIGGIWSDEVKNALKWKQWEQSIGFFCLFLCINASLAKNPIHKWNKKPRDTERFFSSLEHDLLSVIIFSHRLQKQVTKIFLIGLQSKPLWLLFINCTFCCLFSLHCTKSKTFLCRLQMTLPHSLISYGIFWIQLAENVQANVQTIVCFGQIPPNICVDFCAITKPYHFC